MQIKEIVGIDTSKETFDARIKSNNVHSVFGNNHAGFKKFKKWLQKHLGKDLTGVMIVLEHTGLYSYLLEEFMHQEKFVFCKVPALEIKRSLGIVHGKNDKIDTGRIANYGWKNRETLKTNVPQNKAVFRLKNLISLRDKFVRHRAGYQARMGEMKICLELLNSDKIIKAQKAIIAEFNKQIKDVESEIQKTIKVSEDIKQSYSLLTSIKGVGPVLATYMIVYTENFTKFENARQFACYVGIAPFPYSSGTSVKAKTKVSHSPLKRLNAFYNSVLQAQFRITKN